jgi:repressor LexA
VIGRIAADGPINAVGLPGEYVPVPPGISSTHEHFVPVVGDSMIAKAVISGDRVVVRCGCEVRNGDTVVARFDSDTTPEASPEGDATLKTFKRANGHVWLLPENLAYDLIPGDRAKVVGKAVYISRTVRRTAGQGLLRASGIRHPASGIRHPASGIRHPLCAAGAAAGAVDDHGIPG